MLKTKDTRLEVSVAAFQELEAVMAGLCAKIEDRDGQLQSFTVQRIFELSLEATRLAHQAARLRAL